MGQKIGLALSGGGYRGVAHVGALRFIEEIGLDIQVVAGTSAGAIVGALYAAGNPPESILQLFKETELFEFSYFRWRGPGLLNTPRFKDYLTPHLKNDDFKSLDRELYILATDLLAGEEVVFDRGPLTEAILASAAFPGIFSPIEIGDRLLVDGGIFNNLPINVAREKADLVVAMDVNPINQIPRKQISNTYHVIKRSFELATRRQSREQKKYADVFLSPPKAVEYPMFAHENADKLYELGYEEARKHRAELLALKE